MQRAKSRESLLAIMFGKNLIREPILKLSAAMFNILHPLDAEWIGFDISMFVIFQTGLPLFSGIVFTERKKR